MFLDYPSVTTTSSAREPGRIARCKRVYGAAAAPAGSAGIVHSVGKLTRLHGREGAPSVSWNAALDAAGRGCLARAWAGKAGGGARTLEHAC